jgi:hypothetical protein
MTHAILNSSEALRQKQDIIVKEIDIDEMKQFSSGEIGLFAH